MYITSHRLPIDTNILLQLKPQLCDQIIEHHITPVKHVQCEKQAISYPV